MACHQACNQAARIQAARSGLDMAGQAPVEFAVQHQRDRVRQGAGNGIEGKGRGCPVLTFLSVPPADHVLQLAFTIGQRHGHAVDLGLHPNPPAVGQPAFNGLVVGQFAQTGVGHGVRHLAPCCVQRVTRRRCTDATLPLFKARPCLIVLSIRHEGNA